MTLGVSDPVAITVTVAGVFVAFAAIALLRVVLRRDRVDRWRRVRVGFYVERDVADDPPRPGAPPRDSR